MKKSVSHRSKEGSKGSGSGRLSEPGKPPPPQSGAVEVCTPKPALSLSEQTELDELEKVIKGGWKTFLEVGVALAHVRDKGLYKGKYASFEDYWRIELGFSRSYAYNLIGSAEVNKQLSSIEDITVKPLNEAQLRELIPVPEEKRAEAWKSAIELAGDNVPTAKIVHKAALKFKPRRRGRAGKAKTKKAGSGKRIDVKPALILIDEAAGLVTGNAQLLDRLNNLREMLLGWAGKTARRKA